MSFLSFRIRGRLYGGFGILLVFCASLAGFAIWQLTSIRDQVGVMELQSKNAIRVGDIATELQAIRRAILRAAGIELDRVLKTTVFLIDMADFTAMNEVYAEYFTNDQPARSTIAVAQLPRGARFEIECIAQLGSS